MNRITTKPQRKTVLRTAAVVGAAVLGLTATACGRSDEDSSKVAEASSPAASVSGSQEPDAETTPSADEPSADPSGSASAEAGPSESATTRPFVISQGEEKPEAENADRRPSKLVLSEFTTVDRITWKQWTGDEATGSGEVTGTWCLETCQDKPLKGTVTLTDPKTVNGKRYFSAYTLKLADGTKKTYDTEDLSGKRQLATP